MRPSLSIVLVAYQAAEALRECLASVRLCAPKNAQIVIIDNHSGPEVRAVADVFAHCSNFEWIWNSENVGYGPAVVQAVEKCHGDHLLFLNPDTMLYPGVIEQMQKALSQWDAVGPMSNYAGGQQAVAAILDPEDVPQGPRDGAAMHAALRRKVHEDAWEAKLLIGFCWMVRREAYLACGGMDPELILGLDDLDISWRLRRSGFRLAVLPKLYVYHRGHQSFEALSQPNVHAWELQSHQVLSRKLCEAYGDRESIPNSQILWGIDWFVPAPLQPVPAQSQSSTRDHGVVSQQTSLENQAVNPEKLWLPWAATAVVILVTPEARDWKSSLSYFRDLGLSKERLLILDLNSGGLASTKEPLLESMAIWAFPSIPSEAWPRLQQSVQKWFGLPEILYVEAGQQILVHDCVRLAQGDLAGMYQAQSPHLSFGMWMELYESAVDQVPVENPESGGSKAFHSPLPPKEKAEKPLEGLEPKGLEIPGLEWSLQLEDVPKLATKLKEFRLQDPFQKLCCTWHNALLQSADQAFPFAGLDVNSPASGLNFFELERLWNQAGWVCTALEASGDLVREAESLQYLQIQNQGRQEWESLLSCAPVLHAHLRTRKLLEPQPTRVSIVLLALNQLEYTRQCIESLQRNVKIELELILVDNGSTDGTWDYFRSIPGAIVIHNDRNLGVAAGWNQGMARATGEFILILNNDTIVPAGAIENMVRLAQEIPDAGVVAPRSNRIAGPQLLPEADQFPRGSIQEIEEACGEWQEANAFSAWQFQRIKGFCMLIPRKVVDLVGGFDERFGYGNFEDDDYSLRVALHGFGLWVADDSVIFHYGSVSFNQAGIDWTQQMKVNHQKFLEKWKQGRLSLGGLPKSHSRLLSYVTEDLSRAPIQEPKQKHQGNQSHVFIEIPNSAPLKQLERTESKTSAQEWWQMARLAQGQNLREETFQCYCQALAADALYPGLAEDVVAWLRDHSSPEETNKVLAHLSKQYPQSYVLQASLPGLPSGLTEIEHLLEMGQAEEALKLLDCIQGPLAKGFAAWNARGIACFYLGRLADAFLAFEQAIVLDPCHEDVLMNLMDCGVRLRDLSRVQVYFERALALEPGLEEARRALEELQGGSVRALEDPVRWFELRDRNRSIENLIREGLLDQAHSEVHALLGEEPGSERAWNNKGLLLWYQGNVTAAWDCFYRAIELNPLFSDAVVNLYDAALLLDRKNVFEPILRRALELAPYHKELLQMRKELDANLIPERLQGYLDQRYLGGRREEILADAEALIEKADYVQAARLYLDLVDRDGQDAEAMNGLGLTAWYMGRTEDAWIAFKASAEMRVDEETLMNLWDTALALNRTSEISSLILNALEVDPQMQELKDLVQERLL